MAATPMTNLDQLQRHCAALPPGPVANVATVERLLAACWHEFGGDDGGMEGYKLLNRMEAVTWNSPILTFRIDRHGETVLGSTRARRDEWKVDLKLLTTKVKTVGRPQVRPRQQRLDVKPAAA